MTDSIGSGGGDADAGGSHPLRRRHAVADLSLDTVFDLLASQRRRYALYALHEADDGASGVEGLAETVAAREARDAGAAPDADRVAASLAHVHLPKLDDACVVDFDRRAGDVRYWGHPVLEEYLLHVSPIEWD